MPDSNNTKNFLLKEIPERTSKPRDRGIAMVMDKGMSMREIENFLQIAAPYSDFVKLGFGTAYVTPNLSDKLAVYKDFGVNTYFGGTLFEAFVARDQFDDYLRVLEKFDMKYAEVSDGSLEMSHDDKLEYIRKLAQHVTVLSEVGSKDAEKVIPPYMWVELMKTEIEAGAWKVIGEAREGGNVGIYRGNGEVRSGLVQEILHLIPKDTIIWEAPKKEQQVWFIKLVGHEVNLGNIAPNEVIPLETLRLGLRGDTFHHFLDAKNR